MDKYSPLNYYLSFLYCTFKKNREFKLQNQCYISFLTSSRYTFYRLKKPQTRKKTLEMILLLHNKKQNPICSLK